MTLIGLVGNKGVGKNIIGDYFVKKYKYKKKYFSEPLKKGVQQWFGFTDDQLYTDKKEEIDDYWGVSPREVYQIVGTELIRNQIGMYMPSVATDNCGLNFWIRSFDKWYNEKDNRNKNIIIEDVRFQNEIDYIIDNGGYIIRVYKQYEYDYDSDTNIVISFFKQFFGCCRKKIHITEQTEYLECTILHLKNNCVNKKELYEKIEVLYKIIHNIDMLDNMIESKYKYK